VRERESEREREGRDRERAREREREKEQVWDNSLTVSDSAAFTCRKPAYLAHRLPEASQDSKHMGLESGTEFQFQLGSISIIASNHFLLDSKSGPVLQSCQLADLRKASCCSESESEPTLPMYSSEPLPYTASSGLDVCHWES
jgi:hypothetical protein